MDQTLRILILEDVASDADLAEFELQEAGFVYAAQRVMTEEAFVRALEEFAPDLILSDFDLPQYNGLLALAEARARCPDVPFILVTGAIGEDRAIETLTQGAKDYVMKSRLHRLVPAVRRALAEAEEHRARKKAEEELREAHKNLERQVEQRTAELQAEIGERRLVEEALREGRERYRTLFSSMNEGFALCEAIVNEAGEPCDYRYLRVNPAFERITGLQWDKIMRRTAREVHPNLEPYWIENLCQVALTGEPAHVTGYIQAIGRYLEISAFCPVPGRFGCLLADITERWRMEEVLHSHLLQLEAVNKELESFSYSVSHDLKAPLRAIRGFSQMILRDKGPDLDALTRQRVAVIQENAERMELLIADLLTLSKVSQQALSFRMIDMDSLVRTVCKECEATYPEKPLVLKVRPLPPAYGDHGLIRQVLVNLMSNAVKYSYNRQTVEIEAGCRQTDMESIYYVRDRGTGFDMKYYDKLFCAFQRLHSAPEVDGTGVGLSIAQRIIHRHGGRIWAEGKVNEGATFYFMLPRERTEDLRRPG